MYKIIGNLYIFQINYKEWIIRNDEILFQRSKIIVIDPRLGKLELFEAKPDIKIALELITIVYEANSTQPTINIKSNHILGRVTVLLTIYGLF